MFVENSACEGRLGLIMRGQITIVEWLQRIPKCRKKTCGYENKKRRKIK